MLSRVAENLYWLGRYVERAENTARMVNVNANLLLDLPKGTTPEWQPLVAITGADGLYRERHGPGYDERTALRFLIAETTNPGSMLSSLSLARENARTIRDFIPREAWEQINEMYLHAKDNLASGLSKRGRYPYLKRVILGAQTLTGMLAGTMTNDAGYDFLRIGRNLERADMTIRLLDVRSASLLPDDPHALRPFENILWMSVLKSLTAYQMYRRKMQARVRRQDVLSFLFKDTDFPRAFLHCLSVVEHGLWRLPRNDVPLRATSRVQRTVQGAEVAAMSQAELHAFIDQLEIAIGHLSDEISRTYFLAQPLNQSQSQTETGVETA
jgi:uncharacterized alpha-E superfamily protein